MLRHVLGRLTVVLVLAGAAAPTLGAGTAHACSCVPRTDMEAFRDAGAVFTGTLVSRDRPNADSPTQSSLDPAIHTFAVDRVYKGRITDPQRVASYVDGASCGLELRGTGPFLVFTRGGGSAAAALPDYPDLPMADLCGGTRPVAGGETLPFGAGRAPAAASNPSSAGPSVASPSFATEGPDILGPSSDAADEGAGAGTAIALAVAAAALIGGGLVLRARGRR